MITTENLIARLGAEDLRGKLPVNNNHQWKKRDSNKIQGIVLHQALGWSTLEQIAKYHTGANSHLKQGGVHSISYTIGIRRSGRICVLNDIEDKTWSQGEAGNNIDENAVYLGVVNEGLFRWKENQSTYNGQKTGEPTSAQIMANLFVWDTCAKIWNLGIKDIYGHYHLGKESCPGLTLKSTIDGIRNQFDFSNKSDRTDFLKLYKFKSTLELQKAFNEKTGSGIDEDNLWGGQSSYAAYWWAQNM